MNTPSYNVLLNKEKLIHTVQDLCEEANKTSASVNDEQQRAEGVEGDLNTRLETVEELATISVSGGDIGIATAADFNNPDAEARAKVPTVGAIYDSIDDFAVYDISAHNGGATYADLAAALGTNGANVPVNIRKGGMSVKFVQTSDNKYVQYFLTKNEWSVSEADWEKTNLEEEVSQLSQKVNTIVLKQYNPTRLATPVFSSKDALALYWLSDDENYECIALGDSFGNQDNGNVVLAWSSNRVAVQTAIKNSQYAYNWLFVRNKNTPSGSISPSEVYLSDLEYLNKEVTKLQQEEENASIGQNRIISFRPQQGQSPTFIQWYDTTVINGMNRAKSTTRVSSDFFAIDKNKKLTASVGNSDYKLNIIGYPANSNGIVVIANTVQSYDDYLPINLDYFTLVIRKTDNTDLSVKDVEDYAQVTIASLPSITADKVAKGLQLIPSFYAVQARVISINELVVEFGTWSGSGGELYKVSSTDRMCSARYYLNDGHTVHCICKDGYECNIYYYNSSTNSNYLTGWRKENKISYSEDYDKVCITFKRADGGDVSDSDLDCVDYFSIESLLDELATEVLKYADRPSSGYEDFTLSVDVSVADTDAQTLALQDSQSFEDDKGRIYLPSTYSASGQPTRLIIHCHGASQNYNNGNIFPKASSLVTVDYLLTKGYAVLDVNGLPGTHSFYATTCGNPIAYRSYLAAYKWAIAKYNLYKEIFVIGISAGSVPALQISQIKTIPVLACVTYCGIMDTSRGWMLLGGYHGNNSQGPDIKAYLADKFAFVGTRPTLGNVDPCSDEEWAYFVSNWIKISGWNPYTMGISSTMTKEQYREIVSVVYGSDVPAWINADYTFESVQKMLLSFKIPERGNLTPYATQLEQEQKLFDTCSIYRKTPLKMFHATNDDVAPYRYSRYFYEMCKRGGSTVEFRTFPSGGHNPVGNTQSVVIDGQTISTNVLSIEVLDWLQRFETL